MCVIGTYTRVDVFYFLIITVTLFLFKPCCKTLIPESQWPESPGFKDQFRYGLKHNICFNFRETCKALRKLWERSQKNKKGKIMDKGRTYSVLRERLSLALEFKTEIHSHGKNISS